jgi:hypothetical protein
MNEDEIKAAWERLDCLGYRAMGCLQALYAGGALPKANAVFVKELLDEHDAIRVRIELLKAGAKEEGAT